MTSGPARIEARDWGWRHAGRASWAVRGLDLAVAPGERVLLLGASGAGKSTVLAGLAGLLRADGSGEGRGELLVDGAEPHGHRGRTGLVRQDPESQLVMGRVGDDVAFGLENLAVPAGEIWPRVRAALDDVGFSHPVDRPTAALSGGEKQRLVLAGVLVMRPGLLLLDEPTANLDPAGAALVRAAVHRVLGVTGATLVVVEHRVGDWADDVDRVVVLEPGGGVAAEGAPPTVFARHGAALAAGGVWVPGHRVDVTPRAPQVGPAGSVVTADGVSFRWPSPPRRPAPPPTVDLVDLVLTAGRADVVVGANGSGKSTLARIVAGLVAPTSGRVLAAGDGRPLHRWRARELAARVGTVFQDPEHQFLTRTVREELLLGPLRTGVPAATARARVDELLDRLRLTRLAAANPFTLSGGEQRRLSVATALACGPDLLVLDEPTFGQDLVTWTELVRLLGERLDAGTAVLTVTHDTEFATALADRRHTMAGGRLRPAGDGAPPVAAAGRDGTAGP